MGNLVIVVQSNSLRVKVPFMVYKIYSRRKQNPLYCLVHGHSSGSSKPYNAR